jgi:hypothetical protein
MNFGHCPPRGVHFGTSPQRDVLRVESPVVSSKMQWMYRFLVE